ncbi:MAG: hypothetical protein L3J88_02385 [Gammaproteobacteria bacterium]|nr:hypothetical protein [Gammaproteobacteria bacterium]MCF6362208.1 hypothetical protein [Gammaproteobacteria bacterium]
MSSRRQEQWIYYPLHPDLPVWAREVIDITAAGMEEQLPFVNDCVVLAAMTNRPSMDGCV